MIKCAWMSSQGYDRAFKKKCMKESALGPGCEAGCLVVHEKCECWKHRLVDQIEIRRRLQISSTLVSSSELRQYNQHMLHSEWAEERLVTGVTPVSVDLNWRADTRDIDRFLGYTSSQRPSERDRNGSRTSVGMEERLFKERRKGSPFG